MKWIVLLISILATKPSKAVFLIEPYLGFTTPPFSHLSYELSEDSKAEWDYSGLLLGLKMGLNGEKFYGGMDVSSIGIDLSSSGEAGIPFDLSGKYRTTYVGFMLGYRFPFNIHAHYTYFISVSYKSKSGDTEGDSLKGDGFGLSAGYQWFNWLVTSFEWRHLKMDQYNTKSPKAETKTPKYKANEYILMVRFPFDF